MYMFVYIKFFIKLPHFFEWKLTFIPRSSYEFSALDLLGAVSDISDTRKKEITKWIYSLQVKPDDMTGFKRCGFYGKFQWYNIIFWEAGGLRLILTFLLN